MKIDVLNERPSQWLYLENEKEKEESYSEEDQTIALLGIIEQEIQKERKDDSSFQFERNDIPLLNNSFRIFLLHLSRISFRFFFNPQRSIDS